MGNPKRGKHSKRVRRKKKGRGLLPVLLLFQVSCVLFFQIRFIGKSVRISFNEVSNLVKSIGFIPELLSSYHFDFFFLGPLVLDSRRRSAPLENY